MPYSVVDPSKTWLCCFDGGVHDVWECGTVVWMIFVEDEFYCA